MKLYHYTSFDSFVKIWLTKQLKFSPLNNVNDILEIDYSVMSNNPQQLPLYHAFIDLRLSYRQISFTMDYSERIKGCMSPMMWGLYADKLNGVCLEIDFDKLDLNEKILHGEVKYVDKINKVREIDSSIRTIGELHEFMVDKKEELMFTKFKCWAEENEYRILSRDLEYLDISKAISAVNLTSYESLEYNLAEKLVGSTVPIQYFHYASSKDSRPIMSDARQAAESMKKVRNGKKIYEQSKKYYELHKGDWNYDIRQAEYDI